jgi:hypothetical protein
VPVSEELALAVPLSPDADVREQVLAGARCRVLLGLGARHLSFGPPLGPDPVTAIRQLGDLVLPALEEIS